ncbi:MAG: DMT family transporter [Rhizobiaceae bacterium]|nr:DMT family transporter [Rhizobiaceae bacterium]
MSPSAITTRFNNLPANAKGAAFLMVAALFFSLMVALIKLLGQNYNITQILLVRQAIMTAIVAPAIWQNFPDALKSTRPGLQLIRIVLALVAMLLGFTAVVHLKLADVTAIAFAKSFFVTIFAVIILKETVGLRRWAAVGVGFIGVMIMLRPGADAFSIYGLYAVISAGCAGLVMVIIRIMSRTDAPITILTWQAIGVGLVIAIPGIWFWQWPSPVEWLIFIAMGIVSYIAQMFNIHAYKWGEASVLASLDYVRLIYATILGYLIFSNLPGSQTWIGAAIIIAASIYTIRREAKRKQKLVRSPEGRGFNN